MSELSQHNLFRVPDNLSFRDAAVALIQLDDGRYLMQLRDDKPGIFYPDHWGLFGGAIDAGEDPETALRRELKEELSLDPGPLSYFTRIDFDFDRLGVGRCARFVYEVRLQASAVSSLRLGEGQHMEPLDLAEITLKRRTVPYDSFVVWLHYAQSSRGSV